MLRQEERGLVKVANEDGRIKLTDLLEVGLTICISGVIYIGTGRQGKE